MDDDDLFAVEYTAEKAGEASSGSAAALFVVILAIALLATYFLVRR